MHAPAPIAREVARPRPPRLAFLLAALGTAPVWYALSRITTYDATSYLPLTGYAASHGTWLLLLAACLGAILCTWRGRAAWLSLAVPLGLAGALIAVRLAIAASTPPPPEVAPPPNCSDRYLPLLCSIGHDTSDARRAEALADLRRPLNLATGAALLVIVVAGIAGLRRRAA